ncbi:sulfurtransferase TusA family protein [Salibaculum griseiflavum]|uniref:Preprotein translocase subunit TatB n=1 Tax=Salibaculum griseiflavum TaxID=1914409 RepID=A0A2V1P741_9RHOB|nr:sulfurtransferase TusA family protein [Salibaculum griseiflavum]PWG18156.1 preprotein translocase subunit TatB [Salibaculum griseiflavum]
MSADATLDARGLKCPLPVLRAGKFLREMAPGDRLRVLADDPVAVIDIPHFCHEAGHDLLEQSEASDHQLYLIARGPDR